jgi:FtsH-binding integral membrane protein
MAESYYGRLAKMVLGAVLVIGFGTVAWCLAQDFPICAQQDFEEGQKLGLNVSADIVKLLLTLSTTLAAIGGATALGWTQASDLNVGSRVLIIASTCCFVFSAYFALLWQSRLSQVLYRACPQLIVNSWMRDPLIAQFYFFLFGLILIGSLAFWAVLARA